MTQLNPSQSEEKNYREAGHSEQSGLDMQVMRNARWGAVLLAIAGLAFFVFAIMSVSFTDWEDYILVGFPLLLAGVSLASIYIMQQGRVEFGSGLVFVLNLILPVLLTVIVADSFWAAFYYATVSSALLIWRALPRRSWLWSIVTACTALVVIVVTNVIDSPNRFTSPPGFDVFVVAVIAGITLAFVVQAARQAWSQNNIHSRFLTFSLGLTLLASVIIAVISVNSLFSAGQQAQEVSSQALRSQVQEFLGHQTYETANKNDLILQNISQDAQDVAQQAAGILENSNAFNTEAFWNADEHMFVGPEGQYINDENDTSTVFIPNTVTVDDNFKQRLETLAFLNMAFVPVYEGNPNTVAIYFVGRDEISWLYPNINLGALVPPDYLATQDIFYTIGNPQNNPERQVVWTPVYDDPGGQGLLVSAIAPVYTGNTFQGVIGIDVSLANLTATIETEDFGSEGTYAFLLDSEGRALALPEQGYIDLLGRGREPGEFGVEFASSAQAELAPILDHIFTMDTGFHSVIMNDQEYFIAHTTLPSTNWHLVSVASATQVLAPANAVQTELEESSNTLVFQRILPVGLVIIIAVVVASIFFTNRLVEPIERLKEGAAKIGAGEWDTSLPQSGLSEIDALSQTLRAMATQLKSTLDSLEDRVAERTSSLELAASVGQTISQVSDLDSMLTKATQLILEQFDLYYVQVYLTDLNQTALKLKAGTGEVGVQLLERGHSLPVSTASINGRAAIEKRAVVISDTVESLTFHPNPLLPETRGEMALPLIAGEKVVGVLDLQTRQPGKLSEELLPAYEALAGQLAVAIQNATLLEEAEQARAEIEAQTRRQIRANWVEHLDAIHKPEQIGFVYDRSEILPLGESEEFPDDSQAVTAPISLTGEELGSLVVEVGDENKKEQTNELVGIVARQVAQQIENLRLLESAERYRHEAEQAARRQTAEGWQKYIESRATDSMGYLYDLKEVRPYSNGHEDEDALTLPLKARENKVGKLSVRGLSPDDRESFELANAVVERLGAHIESLRLFEETRHGQFELDKRAKQLAAVAQVSTASSQEMDVQKMLETVVHLTQRQFSLYHAHVFTYDEAMDELAIVACGYREGDEHEGTHGTSRIPLSQEQSLVARAARTKQAVIVNDVLNEPGWLPNPLLPETRAELAVPLLVGDELLGVLDVQSEHLDAFTEELASQVAIALQNARSYAQAQKQAERETMLNTINQKIQSATSVEAVLQIAARELGHALGAPMTIAQLSMKEQN